MFEGLIVSVLNRIIGNFVENLDANQLSISLWNGSVSLENLEIKKDLFDSMPVPFKIAFGNIGKIYVEVPIRNIAN
jgi:vacuolar protein sorting-associated protein 13A/C